MLDINLTGQSANAVISHMLSRKIGSIIITSSGAGLRGVAHVAHYCAAKHSVVGLIVSTSGSPSCVLSLAKITPARLLRRPWWTVRLR